MFKKADPSSFKEQSDNYNYELIVNKNKTIFTEICVWSSIIFQHNMHCNRHVFSAPLINDLVEPVQASRKMPTSQQK